MIIPCLDLLGTVHFAVMSVAEIMKELPKLSTEERSAVLRRLKELEEQDELQFLHEAADTMFQGIEREERRDAHRKTR